MWSAEEAREFLDSLAGDRLYALWVLMITTGVRRGEALGLQWRDVDLAKGRLAVRRARVVIGYEVQEAEPKTTAGKRSVSLDATTARVLSEHRRRQKEERLAAGPAWVGSDHLFTNEDGSPIHPDRISKLFVQHVRESGLPTIRLHDLRHTAATLALDRRRASEGRPGATRPRQHQCHPRHVLARLGRSAGGRGVEGREPGFRFVVFVCPGPLVLDTGSMACRCADLCAPILLECVCSSGVSGYSLRPLSSRVLGHRSVVSSAVNDCFARVGFVNVDLVDHGPIVVHNAAGQPCHFSVSAGTVRKFV